MNVSVYDGSDGVYLAEACSVIHAEAFAASGQRSWSEDEFETLLSRRNTVLFFMQSGFLLSDRVTFEAEILTLAVSPEAQRQGCATALLNKFAGECRGWGVNRCFLEVAVDNDAAIALYERHDFAREATRPGYFKRGKGSVDALVMKRLFP